MELPLSKSGDPIDPLWAAEFCGLFWGEGMLSLHRVNRVRQGRKGHMKIVSGPFFRNEIIMVLRADDEAVLRECETILGGHISIQPGKKLKNQSPTIRWVCSSMEDCRRVGQVLSCGKMATKKSLELPPWLQSLYRRPERGGKHLTAADREQLEELRQEILAIRAYSLDKVQVLQSRKSFLLPSSD